ncbi:MAG: tetratricopeptide repeat protein, partial [Myxococcota bacterium]
MMTLLAFVLTSLSFAQPAGSGRDIAQTAMRLEIKRDRLAVTPSKLKQLFNDACSGGYQLACDRNTWLDDGEPSPRRVRDTFRPDCETNDAIACMAYAWAMIQLGDEPKQSEDDRDITYRTVMRVQQSQCEVRGNASACKDMGDLVYGGKGVAIDDPAKAAAVFWDRACDRGEYAACTQVARLMLEGRRIRGKRRSAYDYVKPACDGGYVDGCFLLAQINEEKWDIARRDTVYGDLCQKGHVESCYSLARSYFTGAFPEPAPGRAQELFQQACGLEHARSCFEAGRGTDDQTAAEDYFREACELDDAAGCKALVDRILERGQPGAVKGNYKAFEKACDQRQSELACEWLAQHLLDPDAQE